MRIVVTGATGNVGRPLVRTLAAAGHEVTAVARRPASGPDLPGVRALGADIAEPSGLREPLDGAAALFLLTSGDFLGAGGDVGPVLEAAANGGVRRVVLLSSQGVATGRHPAGIEDAVTGSGLAWTILRPGGFASNALRWAPGVRSGRTIAAPFGDVALPVVDPRDIADVAVAALTGDGRSGAVHELTGPEAVTPRQQAEAIAGAVGLPIRFAGLTRAEAREEMLRFMPGPVAESTLGILGEPSPREQQVSPAVAEVLGRPARSFADWARANREAFLPA
ncbi:NAD(P)H-binding protein [Myceligenerans crystallogenes]|uniref:NAD(P)H-binding protein n=1 Tax=Myceligenerans crystallogenes TaxID=316335 RepID=A0ABN2N6V5_9MICO